MSIYEYVYIYNHQHLNHIEEKQILIDGYNRLSLKMSCIWNTSYMALFESGASLNPPVNGHFPCRNCPFESFLQYSSFSDRPKKWMVFHGFSMIKLDGCTAFIQYLITIDRYN